MSAEETAKRIQAIQENIVAAYDKKYPNNRDLRIKDIKLDMLGGSFALVEYKDGPDEVEEICFVNSENVPEIADSDKHLLEIILRQVNVRHLFERIFARDIIAGFAFLAVIGGVLVALFRDVNAVNSQVLPILGSLAGTAAGFYFGASKTAEETK